MVDNERRGAMLVVADLWMGMNVPSDGDQSLVQSDRQPGDLGASCCV
jgi:hypothetical protein